MRDEPWRNHLLEGREAARVLLAGVRRMAVLGIKTASHHAAYLGPLRAQEAGIEVVPVPVYFPDVTEILGQRVYRTLAEIPGELDLVNVFRRPQDLPQHLADILAKRPRAVWFQLGIRHDDVAEQLARAGIYVVQDQCVERELFALGR